MIDVRKGFDVGELVSYRRQVLGWNRAQLAARAGVSYGTIKNIETGKTSPSLENSIKVITALGCQILVKTNGI